MKHRNSSSIEWVNVKHRNSSSIEWFNVKHRNSSSIDWFNVKHRNSSSIEWCILFWLMHNPYRYLPPPSVCDAACRPTSLLLPPSLSPDPLRHSIISFYTCWTVAPASVGFLMMDSESKHGIKCHRDYYQIMQS